MKLTPRMISDIQIALTAKNMNQSELGTKLGFSRSHISKLLKGSVDTISQETIDEINDALGIDLAPVTIAGGSISPAAYALSGMAEHDPELASLLGSLRSLITRPMAPFLPQVDQKHLPKLGAEITQIVARWEEHNDPHYSRIAVEVLDALRRFYQSEEKKKG